MLVEKIEWISESAKEAKVLITDGQFYCTAFSQPCDVNEGMYIDEPLQALMVEDLMLTDQKKCVIKQIQTNDLVHKCMAQVVNLDMGIVKIGKILIQISDYIPGGIIEGDFVEFTCLRFDIY